MIISLRRMLEVRHPPYHNFRHFDVQGLPCFLPHCTAHGLRYHCSIKPYPKADSKGWWTRGKARGIFHVCRDLIEKAKKEEDNGIYFSVHLNPSCSLLNNNHHDHHHDYDACTALQYLNRTRGWKPTVCRLYIAYISRTIVSVYVWM